MVHRFRILVDRMRIYVFFERVFGSCCQAASSCGCLPLHGTWPARPDLLPAPWRLGPGQHTAFVSPERGAHWDRSGSGSSPSAPRSKPWPAHMTVIACMADELVETIGVYIYMQINTSMYVYIYICRQVYMYISVYISQDPYHRRPYSNIWVSKIYMSNWFKILSHTYTFSS